MKNQYLCDIGDYGKYGLMRFIAEKGVRIGINWYLTENDGSNDGKHKAYLDKEEDRFYDPELFDTLKKIREQEEPTVEMIREERLIPGAEYYSAMIPVRPTDKGALQMDRRMWFNNSYLFLGDSYLIFMDPDNGINYRLKADSKNSEKYVLPEEIEKYYLQGHDIVVYCHKGRRTPDSWGDAKIRMRRIIRDAQIIGVTSHRGTQRTYLFILHPDNYRKYVKILNEFEKTAWGGMFSREPVYGNVLTPEEEQRWG